MEDEIIKILFILSLINGLNIIRLLIKLYNTLDKKESEVK